MKIDKQCAWLLACVALGACGGEPPDSGRGETQQAALTEKTVDFNLVCDQIVAFCPVDEAVARKYVPSQYDLFIENGAAQIMVILQNCSHAEWDGEELAPLEMQHVWIRRDGPYEVIPIPGTVVTQPSFYWYQHTMRTTSRKLFVKAKQAGFNVAMADSIELGPASAADRYSFVVEKDLPTGSIGFDLVSHVAAFPTVPIGINHHVLGDQSWSPEEPAGDGKSLEIYDRGYVLPTGWQSPAEITTRPKSDLAKFGEDLNCLSYQFELHFTATIATTDLEE